MSKRNPYDFYTTPPGVIDHFLLSYLPSIKGDILDPGAGSGEFGAAINRYNKEIFGKSLPHLTGVEIRKEERDNLKDLYDYIILGDYLSWSTTSTYDLIIGNPPYNQAMEFVEKSLSLLKPDGKLIFLLRTAFLESKKRYYFWKRYPITDLYVLSSRPSFTGKGIDATSYSWFIWDKAKRTQTIKVI